MVLHDMKMRKMRRRKNLVTQIPTLIMYPVNVRLAFVYDSTLVAKEIQVVHHEINKSFNHTEQMINK